MLPCKASYGLSFDFDVSSPRMFFSLRLRWTTADWDFLQFFQPAIHVLIVNS